MHTHTQHHRASARALFTAAEQQIGEGPSDPQAQWSSELIRRSVATTSR